MQGLYTLVDYFVINQFFEGLKKSSIFWLAISLVESEAGQDTG